MPDPNQNNPNQNTVTPPTNSSNVPVSKPPVSSIFPGTDLPPLPPDFQSVTSNVPTPPAPPKPVAEPVKPTETSGSAAPISGLPPMISSTPKKKFGGGRIIATILGLLVLVGGVGAGLLLTGQTQIFAPRANVIECFPAGTKITLSNGTKENIEDVQSGEKVLSEDTGSGVKTVGTVQKLLQLHSFNMCNIQFADNESLKVTDPHPFYTKNGWEAINVQAAKFHNPDLAISKLSVGDSIAKEDGTWDGVTGISCSLGFYKVYNLTVDNNHDYFAGGFLAHNKAVTSAPGTTVIDLGKDSSGAQVSKTIDNSTGKVTTTTTKNGQSTTTVVSSGTTTTPAKAPTATPTGSCTVLCLKNATPTECLCAKNASGNYIVPGGVTLPPPNTVEHFANEPGTSINSNTSTDKNGYYVEQDGTIVDGKGKPITSGIKLGSYCKPSYGATGGCDTGMSCSCPASGNCSCTLGSSVAPPGGPVSCATSGYSNFDAGTVTEGCSGTGGYNIEKIAHTGCPSTVSKDANGVQSCWCTVDSSNCHGTTTGSRLTTTTTTTTTAGPTAVCSSLKAYSSTWVLLTATDLSALKSGTSINFCSTGSASSGTLDMARFTINGTLMANTTAKRPSSSDYCQAYTIPAAVTTFNVSAQIHHSTLGWF